MDEEKMSEKKKTAYRDLCNCMDCELKNRCVYKDKFQRLPRDMGGLSKCARLPENDGKLQF